MRPQHRSTYKAPNWSGNVRTFLDRLGLRADRAATWLALLLSTAITTAVYGPVLRFSFFFDDVLDLSVTEQVSVLDLLARPAPGSVYYRPVPFIIWKTLHRLVGAYDPLLLHLLPVVAHAISGWLLFLLLRRVTGSLWAFVPSLLFLLYPFSYQAVAILGTLVHTLVTVQILAVMLLWYEGRTLHSPARLAAAGMLSITALLTHEYAAAIMPLLLGVEVILWYQRAIQRPTGWLALPAVAEALYVVRLFTLERPEREPVTIADTIHNAGFWLQGFAFPITRQTAWLTERIGGDPLRLVLPLGLFGVAGAVALYWLAGKRWIAFTTLCLGGVIFLPAAVTLTYAYVANGPRLLYVVAPASATFWGLLPMLRWANSWQTRLWRITTLVLLGVIVVQSVLFIERRLVMFEHGTVLANDIISLGERHEGEEILILNAPSWFAPRTQEFPRGHLGVQLQPVYAGFDRLIYVGSGRQVPAESRSLAPNVNGWRYDFDPHGSFIGHPELDTRLRSGTGAFIVDLYHDRLALRPIGSISPSQPAPVTWQARFGKSLRLIDSDVTRDGTLLIVRTRWYVDQPLPGDYRPRYVLRTADGRVLLEHERYALSDMSAPRLWQAGDLVDDEVVLDLATLRAPDTLIVTLALVNRDTTAALPVDSATGTALDGTRLVIE